MQQIESTGVLENPQFLQGFEKGVRLRYETHSSNHREPCTYRLVHIADLVLLSGDAGKLRVVVLVSLCWILIRSGHVIVCDQ